MTRAVLVPYLLGRLQNGTILHTLYRQIVDLVETLHDEVRIELRPDISDLPLHLPHPMPQRLRRATDLLGHRPDRRPLRIVPRRVRGHQPHGSFTHFPCVSSRSSHRPIIQ